MAPLPAKGMTCPLPPPLHPQLHDKFWKFPGGRVAPSGTPVAAASSMKGCGCPGPASEGKMRIHFRERLCRGSRHRPLFWDKKYIFSLIPIPRPPCSFFLNKQTTPFSQPEAASGVGPGTKSSLHKRVLQERMQNACTGQGGSLRRPGAAGHSAPSAPFRCF